jgi:nucleotide-binding universal stress UspA family protein
MYDKILVPLDGSERAECVLPHVEALAQAFEPQEVMLVSVTERVTGFRMMDDYSRPTGERLVPEGVGKQEKQAQHYLDKVAEMLKTKGIKTRTEVLLGKPAEEIIIYAHKMKCGLIVMASHGRSGISRWTHGSVADKVFRAADIPVLMIKAEGFKGGS